MHKKDQCHYEIVNTRFYVIEIITLAVLGILTGGEFVSLMANTGLSGNTVALSIITGLQLLIIALYLVVKGLRENGKYEDCIWQNKYYSAKFNELNLEIQEQMSLNLDDKAKDKDFLKSIIKTFNHLMEVSPSVRNKTVERYIDGTKDIDIYKPLLVGEYDTIEIVIQEDNSTIIKISDDNNDPIIEERYKNRNKFELERYLKNM